MLSEGFITAKRVVRRLRGGSQPILIEGEDGASYVCKLVDNPQGTAVLFNEVVSSRLATLLQVPVASSYFVRIDSSLARELYFETPEGRRPVQPGVHYATRLVMSPIEGRIYDILPESCRHLLRDEAVISGGALLHLWLRNIDCSQSIFWRRSYEKKFRVTFIDHGHCLGGPGWKFTAQIDAAELASLPLKHLRHWFTRLQEISSLQIERVLDGIPEEWGCNDKAIRLGLVQCIQARRSKLVQTLRQIAEAPHRVDMYPAKKTAMSADLQPRRTAIHMPGLLA